MVGWGHDHPFSSALEGWHRDGWVTATPTSASCMAHFWHGTGTAPALISAWFTYLHYNDTFSGLQGDNLQSLDSLTGWAGLTLTKRVRSTWNYGS